jgi:hypothetical protein
VDHNIKKWCRFFGHSYVSNYSNRISGKYKGTKLCLYECLSGVSQRSNLGPYLFLLMVDVHKYLQNTECVMDDLKIYREINNDGDAHSFTERSEYDSRLE